ncbi:MAG: hypothetical protein ACE5FZ_05910 [Nitrospiria bacterium]
MRKKQLIKELLPYFQPSDTVLIHDFLSKMDRDYLSLYKPSEIAEHLQMSCRIKREHPLAISVKSLDEGRFRITLVAFDYFSGFSILCGLLSSFGLDIASGEVHTYSDRVKSKIIDVLHVRAANSESRFDLPQQKIFKEEYQVLLQLLEEEHYHEARERVNSRLVKYLGRAEENTFGHMSSLLHPITVRFNNTMSKKWTLLDIQGRDTPFFLYAFSNALAMRNIYLHKVKIKKSGKDIEDRFHISDRRGKKIKQEEDKKALRISAILIKQFTYFLTSAPDPTMAIGHYDQFLDKTLAAGHSRSLLSFLRRRETMQILARLFGTSQFLWEDFLRTQFKTLLPILEQFNEKELRIGKTPTRRTLLRQLKSASGLEEQKKIVNAYKDQEMFRIDMKHLIAPSGDLRHFSKALTDLAEVVIDQVCQLCHHHFKEQYGPPLKDDGSPCAFTICGLGKFGGRELGYASDIELLFVYEGPGRTGGKNSIDNRVYFEKLSQEIIRFIRTKKEGIFHIDTRLRPHGDSGSLAFPFALFTTYYHPEGAAAPFERQSLIKLRSVGGDKSLGKACESARDRFVYSQTLWDLEGAVALRERQINELVPEGKTNVKYSPGGLLDIEYLTQYLQIIHGHQQPEIRTPSTLKALQKLSLCRIIPAETGRNLQRTYLFLRTLIDALRIVRGNAKDLLLPETRSEEFTFLGRRMGYGQHDWEKGSIELSTDINQHMAQAHGVFSSLFKKSKATPQGSD